MYGKNSCFVVIWFLFLQFVLRRDSAAAAAAAAADGSLVAGLGWTCEECGGGMCWHICE